MGPVLAILTLAVVAGLYILGRRPSAGRQRGSETEATDRHVGFPRAALTGWSPVVAANDRVSRPGHAQGSAGPLPTEQPGALLVAGRKIALFGEPELLGLLVCTSHDWIETEEMEGRRRGLYSPVDAQSFSIAGEELSIKFNLPMPGGTLALVADIHATKSTEVAAWLRRLRVTQAG